MIIESVRIVNCNRFTLGGRRDILLKPRAGIQMILGTNGSGKSSFMELCFSPLAPSPNDFDENGYWEFRCSDKGSSYFLSADYKKRKYRFVKDDGENLNPGGTVTVQDALVEQHFGYTRQIHHLLILRNKLTMMSPRERGDVISKVSKEDLTFAYAKFKAWTKELSSNRSVQKFLLGRIAEEGAKLMPEDEKTQILTNIEAIKGELRELMTLERPDHDPNITLEQIQDLASEFTARANHFLSEEPLISSAQNRTELASKHDHFSGVLEVLESELKALANSADTLQSKKEELRRLSGSNVEEIQAEIQKLEGYTQELPEKSIDVPDELLVGNDPLIAQLTTALGGLADDPDESDQQYRAALEKSNKITEALNHSSYLLKEIESRIEGMSRVKEITCPHCQGAFKPGIDEGELATLKERSQRGRQYVAKLDATQSTLSDEIKLLEAHRSALDTLYRLRESHYGSNRGLFLYIDSLGGLKKGKSLIAYLTIYAREAVNKVRRDRILDRLQVLYNVVKEHSGKNLELVDVVEKYKEVDKKYTEQLRKVQLTKERRGISHATLTHHDRLESLVSETMESYTRLRGAIRDLHIKEYVSVVDEEISKKQSTLALNQNTLQNNLLTETVLKDFEAQLAIAEKNVESYKTLVDVINPKTGLIAERMHAQIGAKIEGINRIISKIWNYDFIVKMPDVEMGSLDYRFPIVAGGKERSDISKGSGSMRDIVDTAFAILVHHSLDLTGYPIYLDEFDSPFDGVHTSNMVSMVKDLSDSGRYSHVVVISHDENIQSAFPDAEILVLDDRNLDNLAHTNTHVTFQ